MNVMKLYAYILIVIFTSFSLEGFKSLFEMSLMCIPDLLIGNWLQGSALLEATTSVHLSSHLTNEHPDT